MKNNEMNRKEFLKLLGKGALALSGAGPIISSLHGCTKKSDSSRIIKANGLEYKIKDGVLSQSSKGDDKIKLGVMADIHAHKGNSEYFANQLNQEGAEVYFLAGDLSHSFGDYRGAKDDYNKILDVVEPVAETGKLVLAVPGNHEQKRAYGKALEHLSLKYDNVIDMEKVPVADLDDLTIVALGGISNPNFCVPKGFLLSDEQIEKHWERAIRAYVENDNNWKGQGTQKPILAATHMPKKYHTKNGLDRISKGKNVGSELYSIFLNGNRSQIPFTVSGHIHEAYGILTVGEIPIKQGEWARFLDFNPGAVYDYTRKGLKPSAGILEFKESKARAYILNR